MCFLESSYLSVWIIFSMEGVGGLSLFGKKGPCFEGWMCKSILVCNRASYE